MERVTAIDVLRGLSIIGMVISGQMIWNGRLPAFLFHAQLPPPDFVFRPDVAGITWVDLVFPFFLFSMGAAMPLASRRCGDKGPTGRQVAGKALHRFVWLAAFAILLGNTRLIGTTLPDPRLAALATLAVWTLFFAMFVRIPGWDKRRNAWLNRGGLVAVAGFVFLCKPLSETAFSFRQSDVIILILASMALFGTLLWRATRDKLSARVLLIALVALLHAASSVEGSWVAWLFRQTPAEWLFRWDFLKYLCVVLSGSIAGDLISAHLREETSPASLPRSEKARSGVLVALLLLLSGVLLWGLFVRKTGMTTALSVLLGGCSLLVVHRLEGPDGKLYRKLICVMLWSLALGLVAEPIEGGIKKDPATLGYFFITSAMAAMALLVILITERGFSLRFRPLAETGANPMFAYAASSYLIAPLATLTSLSVPVERLANLSPWCGFLRGILYALLVVAVTCPMTRNQFFWKS